MPDRKSTRGRIRSRTRAKIRSLRRLRSKKVNLEGESSAASQPRGSMASAQQSTGQAASVHGVRGETRQSTLKVWVSQRFGLFLLGFWFLLLLSFYMSTGFMDSVSANNYILWNSENADGQSPNETSALGSLIRFFFPTKPTQMFRVFGFAAMSMIFLGCLPIYCCCFCWRSKWGVLLRRRFNRTLKRLKKHRRKPKRDTEMLETAVDEEGYGDVRDQETIALVSH